MILLLTPVIMAAVVFWVYLLYRRSDIGLMCLLAAEVLVNLVGSNAALLGGLHITPSDAVAFALMLAGALRTMRSFRTLDLNRTVIFCYLTIFAVSLMRGLVEHGLTATGNEARAYVGPLAGLLYFATSPVDAVSVRRYTLSYLCFGVALCAIAAAAAAGLPVGSVAAANLDESLVDGRYLPASGAAALAVCGFLSLAMQQYRQSGLVAKFLPMLFLSFAVYLRHRTVWIMLLAGMVALLLLDFRMFRRLLPFALAAIAAVSLIAIQSTGALGTGGKAQFSDSLSNGSTFMWRLNGWKELLVDDEQNALTVAIGKSVGSGFWRIDADTHQPIEAAPHSEYIQTYLRVGVVGVTLILMFALRPLMRLWRLARTGEEYLYPSASAWAIVVLMTLVYGFTYGIGAHAYALLGIANAIAGSSALAIRSLDEESEIEWNGENILNTTEETA